MAIVGTGFLAKKYVNCYRIIPRVEVLSVASETDELARSFAEEMGIKTWFGDYEKMMRSPDIDVVNVCVPNYLHADVTISAAEHGKHVICTKPMAISLEKADEMLAACDRADVNLMYAENMLFSPAILRLEEILREGALGRLRIVEGREQHSGSHSPFAIQKRYSGGGALLHMGVHPVGLAIHLMGSSVERVYAEVGNLLHDLEVEDYAVVLMRFGNGGSAIAQSNYVTQGGMQDRMEVYGSDGMAYVDLLHASPLRVYSNKGYSYVGEKASISKGWTSPVVDEDRQLGFVNMLDHFIRCVGEGVDCRSPGALGREVLRVVFAAYRSAAEKRAISLSG